MDTAQDRDLESFFFGDLRQSEKLSGIKPSLVTVNFTRFFNRNIVYLNFQDCPKDFYTFDIQEYLFPNVVFYCFQILSYRTSIQFIFYSNTYNDDCSFKKKFAALWPSSFSVASWKQLSYAWSWRS